MAGNNYIEIVVPIEEKQSGTSPVKSNVLSNNTSKITGIIDVYKRQAYSPVELLS